MRNIAVEDEEVKKYWSNFNSIVYCQFVLTEAWKFHNWYF